jgi:hypothetical protein
MPRAYDQTASQLEPQRGLLFFKDQSWSLVRLATESHPTLSEQGILENQCLSIMNLPAALLCFASSNMQPPVRL